MVNGILGAFPYTYRDKLDGPSLRNKKTLRKVRYYRAITPYEFFYLMPDYRAHRPTIMGTTHMVCAGHNLAAAAGYRILEEGGNAIDAGVAAGIAINAVSYTHLTLPTKA